MLKTRAFQSVLQSVLGCSCVFFYAVMFCNTFPRSILPVIQMTVELFSFPQRVSSAGSSPPNNYFCVRCSRSGCDLLRECERFLFQIFNAAGSGSDPFRRSIFINAEYKAAF